MIFTASVLIQAPVEIVFAFPRTPRRARPAAPEIPAVPRPCAAKADCSPAPSSSCGSDPIEWHARHTAYERDRLFVDEQTRGPFARWVHRHEFAAEGRGTRLTDRVDYELPAALAPFGWAVRLSLKRMFAERHRITREACESCASDMST